MARKLYKGYMRLQKRIKTGIIEADSAEDAMLQACRHLNARTSDIVLVKGMPFTCPKCAYAWTFLGFRRLYATCPQCMKQVLISEAKR